VQSGSTAKALELLLKVLEANPNHFMANKNIGAVYASTGKKEPPLH
jgi:hypothetical protein